jgi:thioredoxin reductase (NADPH)
VFLVDKIGILLMIYDVIVVGGGPSGMSAAIYASRSRFKTLLIEKNACGGQIIMTDLVENYPGFTEGINGFDLAMKFEMQARNFGTEIAYDEVVNIKDGLIKKLTTIDSIYETKAVIIATGVTFKKMTISGESDFIGKGVSFCATCDAPFYRNKDVLVVGGGDSAVQEAIYLSKFAKNVTVVHRGSKLKATKILQERMALRPNISIIYDSIPKEIFGRDTIERVKILNVNTNKNKDFNVDGIFVFIGLTPNNLPFSDIVTDKVGYIVTDENMCTSVVGIFACGDIRKKQLRQIVTAVSDGAQASVSVQQYLENI